MSEDRLFLAFLGVTAFIGPALSTCYAFWTICQWLSSETSSSKGMTTMLSVAVMFTAIERSFCMAASRVAVDDMSEPFRVHSPLQAQPAILSGAKSQKTE